MKQEYGFWAKIFCKWLEWHIISPFGRWTHGGKKHGVCLLCRTIISRKE